MKYRYEGVVPGVDVANVVWEPGDVNEVEEPIDNRLFVLVDDTPRSKRVTIVDDGAVPPSTSVAESTKE